MKFMSLQKSLRPHLHVSSLTIVCSVHRCLLNFINKWKNVNDIFLLLHFYRQSISHFIESMCWRQQKGLEHKSLRDRDWKSGSAVSRALSSYEWAHLALEERRDLTCAHTHTHICACVCPCILKLWT